MKVVSEKNKLIKFIQNEKNLGFVPTMGAIHLGHMSIIKKSISQCDKTIVSIFINKPQFNRKSDFKEYPRVLKKDISILKKLGVNYIYLPLHNQIYPKGVNKNIKISPLGKKLCGQFRLGHFEAVADVIDRFIKIIKPAKIYFGNKDFQQLKIIEHFVRKNHFGTKVIACKTVREKSGIPCSSRNFLLTINEKIIASKIYKLLLNKKYALIKNIISSKKVEKQIYKLGANKIDYLKVLDINKLSTPLKKKKFRIFIAYYLGTTRLIDNI